MTEAKPFPDEIEHFVLAYGYCSNVTFDFIALNAKVRFGDQAPSLDEIATFLCRRLRGTRRLNLFSRDLSVATWLNEHKTNGTTDQIRIQCAAVFGPDRTPSRTALAAFLLRSGSRARPGTGAAIGTTMAAWISQVAPHMTLTGLLAALKTKFPRRRMPGRSQLHRYLLRQDISTAGRGSRLGENPDLATWFCDGARAKSVQQLRRGALARFDPASVPSRSSVYRYLQRHLPTGHKRRPGWAPDVDVWVAEHRGLLTLDEMRAACIQRFGKDRSPSRSAIHRRLLRARVRDALA